MLGSHRLMFYRHVWGRSIYNKNAKISIRYIANVTSRNVFNQNRPYLNLYQKLESRNKIDIQIYYSVKCLSCSSHYVNLSKTDDEKNSVPTEETVKVNRIVHLFRRLRFFGQVFYNGCKNLLKDVKIALRTRRKLGLFHQRECSRLTRDEIHHMYQTRADVVKTFPVAFLFMIPFIGYTAPVLAYFYPKQLLSQQFWHPDQKKEFLLEEYEKRSQYYLPLIKECAVTCKEIKSGGLYKLCLHVINGNHPTNNELLEFKDEFSKLEEFSLINVPRYHLVKLCKCWLIPTGWYLPRWYLMNALRKRISRIHQDDMLIYHEGVHKMSPKSIAKAVHLRGLDETALNLPSMSLLLVEWVQLSSQVTVRDVSFLAHCAAFKGANFETMVVKSGVLPGTNVSSQNGLE